MNRNHVKIIVMIVLLVLAIGIAFYDMNPELHFKITKDGIEVDKVELRNSLWVDSVTHEISKQNLTLEWLEEKCLKEDNQSKYVCGEYLVEVWNQIK